MQLLRAAQEIEYERSWGFGEDDYVLLGRAEASARMQVAGCLGAVFSPHGAALDPARLARGLAAAVEKLGVPIYERTPVTAIAPHAAETPFGTVKAEVVVRATEAFTPELPGYERDVVPIYSLMIATEPLSRSDLGGARLEGPRGLRRPAPPHLLRLPHRRRPHRHRRPRRALPLRLEDQRGLHAQPPGAGPPARADPHALPADRPVPRQPPLGRGDRGEPRLVLVRRPRSGDRVYAWAGAYVGDGVSTTNLAGRTLSRPHPRRGHAADRLPWVNHARPWEPEPFRWIGVNLALRMMASADKVEETKGRPSRRAELISQMIGA